MSVPTDPFAGMPPELRTRCVALAEKVQTFEGHLRVMMTAQTNRDVIGAANKDRRERGGHGAGAHRDAYDRAGLARARGR